MTVWLSGKEKKNLSHPQMSIPVTLSIITQRFSAFWIQNPASRALPTHSSLLFIVFLKLPDTFFPRSSHIPPSALEVFHRVGASPPDKFELFRTSPLPDISNHTWLNFSLLSSEGIFDLCHHHMPLNCLIFLSPSSKAGLKSSSLAGVCPATDDPAAPTCRALLCPLSGSDRHTLLEMLSQNQTDTHY